MSNGPVHGPKPENFFNVLGSTFAMGLGLGMLLQHFYEGAWWPSLLAIGLAAVFAIRAHLESRRSKRALQKSSAELVAFKQRFAEEHPNEARLLGLMPSAKERPHG